MNWRLKVQKRLIDPSVAMPPVLMFEFVQLFLQRQLTYQISYSTETANPQPLLTERQQPANTI